MKNTIHLGISQRYALALLALLLSATTALAQSLHGTVTDAHTGEPIIGAAISLRTTGQGKALAVTDVDGRFTVNVKQFPTTLIVNYTGYQTEEVDVYEVTDDNLDIALTENYQGLNEVVVVGYGTQKRRDLTGSVASVKPTNELKVVTNFDDALRGQVAGVSISTTSGQPGAPNAIRIRGGNSITGGNEPLYVIDGVLVYNSSSASSTGVSYGDQQLNPLANINPNDIESIEVLKDVSASAIYGSRGANGVIIVTTKRGVKGKPTIEYGVNLDVSTLRKKLDLLNAQQWGDLYLELASDASKAYTGVTPEKVATWGQGTDWQDEFFHTAVSQQHQLSVSGGSDKEHYLISANYTDLGGIIRETSFKRYGGRFNYDRELFKGIKVGLTINAAKSEQQGSYSFSDYSNGFSGLLEQALRFSPAVSVRNADGSWNYHNPFETGDFVKNGDETPNPVAQLYTVANETKANNFLGSAFVTWKIIKGLTLKLQASDNLINTTQNFYAPSTATAGFMSNGYGSVGNKRWESVQGEATLTYHTLLNKNNVLDIMGGYTTQTVKSESAIASAANFANDILSFHSLQSGAHLVAPQTNAVTSTLRSIIGRVNYSLFDRYHLTATLRADGSSRFAQNHKWGYFPSIGFSWNINDEPFLRQAKWIDNLKLRLSYGTVGNQEIGDYTFLSSYTSTLGYYYFNGELTSGYYRSSLGNPDLKWESTSSFNAGIDWSLYHGRLNFVFDYYTKKTSDLLVSIPVEQTTGFSQSLKNIGNVNNHGVEFAVNGTPIQTKHFNWDAFANIAFNKNKVTSLGSQTEIINSDQTIIRVGEPLGTYYGWQFDGLVQQGDDLSKVPAPATKTNVEYGDAKFVDQNGDGVVDQTSDRVVLGSVQPKFTYGFGSTLTYRDWNFSFVFQGSYGNKLYNQLRQALETPSANYNVSSVLLDRWTPDHTNTLVPKANASVSYSTYLDSRYVEGASYLRLKNIQLGYTFKPHFGNGQTLRINVYVAAQNLLTITDYQGYDPEYSGYVDRGTYPSARTFTFGLKFTY